MIRFITLLSLLASLPSFAATYTVVASGNWSSTTTWSPSGVPGAGDDVVFNFNPSSPLTLTVDGNYTINKLDYGGYGNISTPGKITVLNGTGTLTLTDDSSWTGGFISGSVQITFPSGKTFQLYAGGDSSNRKFLNNNALITNNGTMTWGGTGIFFEDAAQIVNNGTFVDNTLYNRLYRNDGNTSNIGFINNGTFEANSSECHLHAAFVNNGTININSGWVHSDFLLENNGTINLYSSGAYNHQFINYDGTGGTIEFHTNTALEILGKGMAAVVGNITGTNGTLIFANSNSSDATIIDQAIPSGFLLDFSQGGRVTLNSNQSLVSNSGFAKDMDGTGSLTIPAGVTMTWTRGYIGGDVELIVDAGGTLQIADGDNKDLRDNSLLTNNGTVDLQSVIGLATSQVMIQNNGTFQITSDASIYSLTTLPLINNNGAFKKSSGSGTSLVQAGLTNGASGIISAESGTLNFHFAVYNSGIIQGTATLTFPSGQSLGGTIAPGPNIGTLAIQAPSLTTTAVLQIEVNGSSTDQLQLNGSLTLSGARLVVTEAGSPLTPGLNANIIQTDGISGNFSSSTFPNAGYILNISGSNATLSNAPLPLDLTDFQGYVEITCNHLAWETAKEIGTDRFDIERSIDGKLWESIGSVKASFQTDHSVNYSFRDDSPFPSAYYRLKMLDMDGTYTYSWIIELSRSDFKEQTERVTIYPNPCRSRIHASIPLEQHSPVEVIVSGLDGRTLRSFRVDQQPDGIDLDISNLPPGVFLLSVSTDSKQYSGSFRKL